MIVQAPPSAAPTAKAALAARTDRRELLLDEIKRVYIAFARRVGELTEFQYRVVRSHCQTKGEQWEADRVFERLRAASEASHQAWLRGNDELHGLIGEMRRLSAKLDEAEAEAVLQKIHRKVDSAQVILDYERRAYRALFPEPGEELRATPDATDLMMLAEQAQLMIRRALGIFVQAELVLTPQSECATRVRAALERGVPMEELIYHS